MEDNQSDHVGLPDKNALDGGSLFTGDEIKALLQCEDPKIPSRQDFKGARLSFWTVQAALPIGHAFLNALKEKQRVAQARYDATTIKVREYRKRCLYWMDAARGRLQHNKERRKEKITEAPPQESKRARKTCEKRGCYAFVYRDGLCETHYLRTRGKVSQGVTK